MLFTYSKIPDTHSRLTSQITLIKIRKYVSIRIKVPVYMDVVKSALSGINTDTCDHH